MWAPFPFRMEDFWIRVVATVLGGAIGIPIGFAVRRIWQLCFIEYDRSMLIRLSEEGDEEHYPTKFSYVPVIVGQFPFSELGGEIQSNLDVRNVIGFVIGKVKWIDNPRVLGIDPCEWKPGYYAYCVIQWEYANLVKRMSKQGYHIRKISHPSSFTGTFQRETRFIGMGTDSYEGQGIPHFQSGPLAFLRYQPYDRAGFKAHDIKMRQLSLPARTLIWFKNFITEEWKDAW